MSRLLAAAAAAVLLWLLLGPASPAEQATRDWAPLPPDDAFADFQLTLERSDSPEFTTTGAVYAHRPQQRSYAWGTYIGGDAFVGTARSTPFRLEGRYMAVPILGYPAEFGNELRLEVAGADNVGPTLARYVGGNPGERFGQWLIDVSAWQGQSARLVLHDASSEWRAWLGVGRPRFVADPLEPPPAWAENRSYNYLYFFLSGAAVTALLFVPGCVLAVLRRRGLSPAWVAVPGLLLLAVVGWWCWLVHPASAAWGQALILLNLGGALFLVLRPPALEPTGRRAFAFYASLVVGAAAIAALPLPMAQEYGRTTTAAARMVASSGDNTIPFVTAAYVAGGYDGREKSQDYFGAEWSFTSRGPLIPFAVHALHQAWRLFPPEPLGASSDYWPASEATFFLARWLGMLTNALMVFGAWRLGNVLRPGGGAAVLPWLVLAPFALGNTVYLWPKLLAAYFILLAAAEGLERRRLLAMSFWGALAYLSHPVGGLLLPAVAVLLFRMQWDATPADWATWWRFSRAGMIVALLTAAVVAWVSPWLIYKASLGTGDVFLRHPLGAGRGHELAQSAWEWAQTRLLNVWYTFVPGAFYASDHLTVWTDGAVTPLQRWVVNYAKTLPGHLGHVILVVAVWGWYRGWREEPKIRRYGLWWMLPAWIVLLLFSGYTRDGLGRYSLEPMGPLILAAALVVPIIRSRLTRALVLGLAAVEALSVVLLGFTTDPEFAWVRVDAASLWLGLLYSLTLVTTVVLGVCFGHEAQADPERPRRALSPVTAVRG